MRTADLSQICWILPVARPLLSSRLEDLSELMSCDFGRVLIEYMLS